MVERNKSAETEGPVLLEALLHDRYGAVHVHVDPECKVASVRVTTADRDGVAAQAIAQGNLTWDEEARRLTVDIDAPDVNPREGWRVDVWAELPPGSTLDAHTDEADVETSGPVPLRDAGIGGKNHQLSSPNGVVDVTVEYTAPPDVKIQASDIRGPVRPMLSQGFLEVNQHRPPSAAASGLGAGPGATGASAATGAHAILPSERRGAIER